MTFEVVALAAAQGSEDIELETTGCTIASLKSV